MTRYAQTDSLSEKFKNTEKRHIQNSVFAPLNGTSERESYLMNRLQE